MSRKIKVMLALGLAIALALGCVGTREIANKQVVISNGSPDPWTLHVSRGAQDRVAWKNEDSVDHTVEFSVSPFGNAGRRLTIPANSTSGSFVVGRGVAIGSYRYFINPTFQPAMPDSGPGPVVIVDE